MILILPNQPHQSVIHCSDLLLEIWIVKQRYVQFPEGFFLWDAGSGLAWCEILLHLHPAVVTDAWRMLGRQQRLYKVVWKVDTIQSGLGNMSTPMEGVLPITWVEMAKAVRIVHSSHKSSQDFAIFRLKIVGGIALLQDGVPVTSHDRESVSTSLQDVGEEVIEKIPSFSSVPRT